MTMGSMRTTVKTQSQMRMMIHINKNLLLAKLLLSTKKLRERN
jgi:hypothetical protein